MSRFIRQLATARCQRLPLLPCARGAARLVSTTAPRLVLPTTHHQSHTALGEVDAQEAEAVLDANAGLLGALRTMNWEAYGAFCADDISCFEAEAGAQQVSVECACCLVIRHVCPSALLLCQLWRRWLLNNAAGHRTQVVGKPFHQYYFDLAAKNQELGTSPLTQQQLYNTQISTAV